MKDLSVYYWITRGSIKLEILLRLYISKLPLCAPDIINKVNNIDISSASHILAEFGNDKYKLAKCENPMDRRNRYYSITEQGKEIIRLIPDSTFLNSLFKIFENAGYKVEKNPLISGHFVDLIVNDGKNKSIVEFKRENLSTMYFEKIKKMMNEVSINRAIIVTLNHVDKELISKANKGNITIWDAKVLDKLNNIIY